MNDPIKSCRFISPATRYFLPRVIKWNIIGTGFRKCGVTLFFFLVGKVAWGSTTSGRLLFFFFKENSSLLYSGVMHCCLQITVYNVDFGKHIGMGQLLENILCRNAISSIWLQGEAKLYSLSHNSIRLWNKRKFGVPLGSMQKATESSHSCMCWH